jgi:glycosyltransferase involved in cell wall biosynthesis
MSDAFSQRLSEILQSMHFDLIQFEGLEMAGYLPIVREIQPEAKLCYDAHNAEYQLQQGIFEIDREIPSRWPAAAYSYIQYRRIAQFEHEICQQVDCVLAVSDEDAAKLRPFRRDSHIAVIPNGIFTQDYHHQPEKLDLGKCVLTFTGKMDYRPNVDAMLWFASEILPLVHNTIPDAQLYIVGQKPHPRLEHLRDNDHVNLTGWVPEIYPFLSATDVYIAPLRMGSGTRLKILEAMAAGRAVVATSLASAGLPQEARETLKITDTAEAMA